MAEPDGVIRAVLRVRVTVPDVLPVGGTEPDLVISAVTTVRVPVPLTERL